MDEIRIIYFSLNLVLGKIIGMIIYLKASPLKLVIDWLMNELKYTDTFIYN